jgi:hypothetical protein
MPCCGINYEIMHKIIIELVFDGVKIMLYDYTNSRLEQFM